MSGPLPAAELAALQAAVNATLDQSCVISRNAPTATTYGTQTDSWATVATVACGVGKPSANIAQQYADRIGSLAAWIIRLPSGTNVRFGDRLLINGITMTVNALWTPRSFPVALQVLGVEVE